MANVNNYIRAGQAGAQASVNIFSAIRDNAPKYDRIANASIAENAKTKATYTRNEAEAAISRIRAERDLEATKQDVRAGKEIRGIRKNARMTGMLAGGAALLGIGAMQLNKKEEADPTLGLLQDQIAKYNDRVTAAKADIDRLTKLGETLNPDNIDYSTSDNSSEKSDISSTKSDSISTTTNKKGSQLSGGSTLSGPAKIVADAIAKYESGNWGYEAFNQGGAAGGTKVVGKSGSYKDTYGTSLTDMTLAEIFDKQNTKQKGMSMQEHLDSGGLHAVGRYQFIGSTLQDEVSKMGLDPSTTKFTPEIQDAIFKSHIKRVGNISPWVGPMQNYSQAERDKFNSLIQQF